MLRTRTGAGTQVLQAGQTVPQLQVVSLAGRSGFSRDANVHGFAFGNASGGQGIRTATQTRTYTQSQTTTAYRPTISINREQSVAAGGAPPGDPGGSKTITAVEDEKKKKKKDEKAKKKRESAEKRAARKKARKENYVCFGMRRRRSPGNAGASGGGGVPPRVVKNRNEEPSEKPQRGGAKVSIVSRLNPFSCGAPSPGDPDPSPGGGSLFLKKDRTPRRVIRADDEGEDDGGSCGCFQVFFKKKDSMVA
ncbi:hypothetical protein N431DRAFT_556448 [Stipitochalara longipes BDJ]|nr:hypothetical protein N431DRAFT_556448 [Stipitochalara longipes BDJ]